MAMEVEKLEAVTDFVFPGFKITEDGYCNHEIRRKLLLGKRAMTNLDSLLQIKDFTLLTEVHIAKAVVFPIFITSVKVGL